jgi:hypothetical protein
MTREYSEKPVSLPSSEIESGQLKITLKGLYLGKTEEPPSREVSKKWTLA